jgi:resorcinol 4-hydroxylase (FADH2)
MLDAAAGDAGMDNLIASAREVGALARACAERTESERRVPDEVISRAHETGLFRVMQPRVYGGFEYGFEAMIEVGAAVGAGCGSAGWVISLGIIHKWLIAMFPREAQEEFWADRDALLYGSYPPVGKAEPATGGYRVSGSWDFTSGCDHADWLVVGAMLPAEGELSRGPAFFLVPRKELTIVDGWYTMGLAGTGSKTVTGQDIFVPIHRVVPFAELLVGAAQGSRTHDNPLYRQSLLSALPITLVTPLLGMAEGALADFLEMAKVRSTRGAVAGGSNRMAEFATIQSRVAEATGCIEAARLMMKQSTQRALDAARAGTQADPELRQRSRLSQAFSAKMLVQAVDVLFQASGGQAIFTSKPIQRAWRDAHAAAVHVSLNWDAVSTMYGQHALGLEPKGQY